MWYVPSFKPAPVVLALGFLPPAVDLPFGAEATRGYSNVSDPVFVNRRLSKISLTRVLGSGRVSTESRGSARNLFKSQQSYFAPCTSVSGQFKRMERACRCGVVHS